MRFLGTSMVLFFAFTVLGMSALFMYLVNYAERDSAKNDVSREARQAGRSVVVYDDGTVGIDENYYVESEGCVVVVMSGDGKVLSGDLPFDRDLDDLPKPEESNEGPDALKSPADPGKNPDGSEITDESQKAGKKRRESGRHRTPASEKDGRFYIVKEDGETYYVYDWKVRAVHHEDGSNENLKGTLKEGGYFVRAFLSKKNHKTVYQRIELLFHVLLFILILIAVIGGRWLYRKTAQPIMRMCNNMEKVITDVDYSERIKNKAFFYETDVMKAAYNKLMDRNEKLKRLQDEFNENVSHELRTPVAVIRSESELIRDLYADKVPDDVVESAAVIHKQTERINAMISELMYMAKMDREDFALKKDVMELSDIAESVCEDIEEVTLKGRSFVYHWEPSEAEIDVDLIVIAVRNLIMNAVKYSPEGSTIDLYSGTEEVPSAGDDSSAGSAAAESGGYAAEHRFAYLKVTDHGIGISQDEQNRIFDPYYQVKSERNSDGFGLGLSLTMKIAVKHGGTVRVESEPGKGSTFTLVLPVK